MRGVTAVTESRAALAFAEPERPRALAGSPLEFGARGTCARAVGSDG